MTFHRFVCLALAIVFVIVGFVFAAMPDDVLAVFDRASVAVGMAASSKSETVFFPALAAAYMYLVAILAYMMFRYPGNVFFPLLLANAKLASSIVSIGFFVFSLGSLIYILNAVVDGAIGIWALTTYFVFRRKSKWAY